MSEAAVTVSAFFKDKIETWYKNVRALVRAPARGDGQVGLLQPQDRHLPAMVKKPLLPLALRTTVAGAARPS